MQEVYSREFQMSDAEEVSKLIIKTLRTTNRKDYSEEYIENDVKMFTPDKVIERAGWTHFYDKNIFLRFQLYFILYYFIL